MSRRYDCSDAEQRAAGMADAASAIRAGELVVVPTDTVYGIGADAFTPSAVAALLEAKGRGRDMPVPVLVGTVRAANALVEEFGTYGQDLIDSFWPGPLTLVCRASRSLNWDLGDSKGTVAIRMPLHSATLELLKETGPMAVSSANRSGAPPATTAADAEEQLGESVAVYLDGGACADTVPSTIIDLTTPVPRVLRRGAIPVEKLRSVIGYVATDADPHLDDPADIADPAIDADQPGAPDKSDTVESPQAAKADTVESPQADRTDKTDDAQADVVGKNDDPQAVTPDAGAVSDPVVPPIPFSSADDEPAEGTRPVSPGDEVREAADEVRDAADEVREVPVDEVLEVPVDEVPEVGPGGVAPSAGKAGRNGAGGAVEQGGSGTTDVPRKDS